MISQNNYVVKTCTSVKGNIERQNLAAKKWTGLTNDTRSKVGTNEMKSKVWLLIEFIVINLGSLDF